MRPICIVLTAICIVLPGCSYWIASSGKDLRSMATSQEVHAELGAPVTSQDAEGQRVEVFHTRRKISEPDYGEVWVMVTGMTFGLSEVVAFPGQVFQAARHAISGRDVRVTYDAGGAVTMYEVDGHLYGSPRAKGIGTSESNPETAQKAGVP